MYTILPVPGIWAPGDRCGLMVAHGGSDPTGEEGAHVYCKAS